MFKTIFFSLCWTVLLLMPILGQTSNDNPSDYEVFIGYNHQRVERESLNEIEEFDGILAPIEGFTEDDFRNTFSAGNKLNGITAAGTLYLTRYFGITGEFSFGAGKGSKDVTQVATVPGDTVTIKRTKYDFLVGPQFKYRGNTKFEPFVKALAGVTRQKSTSRFLLNGNEIDRLEDNFTAFSISLGGGLDYRLSRHLAVRLFQVEYNPTFPRQRNIFLASSFPGDETVFGSNRRNGFKFSAGIIFR